MSEKIATLQQIPEGTGLTVVADGKEIALYKYEGCVYAIEGTCPHLGGPLGEGSLDQNLVTCPWHGWQFDITSGKCENMPGECVATIPVEVIGDDVFLKR